VEHGKGVSLGYAPALLTNIRLGYKRRSGTNTPAYWAKVKDEIINLILRNNLVDQYMERKVGSSADLPPD
jgi:hypothetical protein